MPARSFSAKWSVVALTGLVSLTNSTTVFAQAAPTIGSTSPQAVAPGGSTNLKVRGANLAGATQLWSSFAGESSLAADVADNGKNAGEVTFKVALPSNAPVGIYGVRVATPGGTSPLRLVIVDDLPSVSATGQNVKPESAQELTLPAAVDGSIPSLGMHYYKFKAEAGQQISIEVVARRLGSALDPIVRLLNAKGRELAYSDDAPGLRSDSQFSYTFKDAGDYVVELRDIQYRGGDFPYRLRIGDFPQISAPFPMSVQRGQTAKVTLSGPNAADVAPVDVAAPADPTVNWVTVSGKRPNGKSSGFTLLKVSDRPEAVETEPNNELAQATRVELTQGMNGRIEKAGDVDHYIFAAKKGQAVTFKAITQRSGAPTAVYLRLLNKSGGQIAAKEDFGAGDAAFNATFPEDGEYVLAVEDLHRRGGAEFIYRVEVDPTQPGFELNVSANTINIGATSTAAIYVNATRQNYAGPIQVSVEGLPEGVTVVPTVLGPGAVTTVLTVRSNAEAATNRSVPVRVVGTAKIGEREVKVAADTERALKTAFSNVAWAPANLDEHVALAVGAKPAVRFRAEPAEVVFGPSLQANVKLIVDRNQGFDEVVNFAVITQAAAPPVPVMGGLPANVTAELKPIAKGTNEIEIVLKATDKAALGDFTLAFNGTIKQGNQTVTEAVPGITLKLQEHLKVTAMPVADKVAAGGTINMKVTIARNPALKGDAVVTFANLPKGVTAAAATIPADKNEVEVALTVAADAAKGAVNNIQAKAEITVGQAKFAGTSANAALTVE